MKRLATFLLILCALPAFGQFSSISNGPPANCPGYRTLILDHIDNWVYSCGSPQSGPAGTPIPQLVGRVTASGTVLPTTCSPAPMETFGLVTAGVTAPYFCSSTNAWTAFGAGGGGQADSTQSVSTSQAVSFLGRLNTLVNATSGGGGITLTLPTAALIAGQKVTVLMADAGAVGVTVNTTGGQTINGLSSYVLTNQFQYVTVQAIASNWVIVANN